MPESPSIPVLVLGGSGYVAGELLRLLAHHPVFRVAAVASATHAGVRIADAFPHLAGAYPEEMRFEDPARMRERARAAAALGVFAATPHGTTAALLDDLLAAAEKAGTRIRAVDLSADFRFRDAARYAAVYGRAHAAPHRLASFRCAVPEHHPGTPAAHAAQPGCFTTAVVLAAFPVYACGLAEGGFFAAAVTGSSGSGRTPAQNTHHPERSGNCYAYAPLAHRHEAEMRLLLAPACGGVEPDVEFVPHSGPFVRGIHATLRFTLRRAAPAEEIAGAIASFYANSPFVEVSTAAPKLGDVVGTNRCRLGVAVRGRTLVLMSAIDNLVKGAAGGGVQWMNRLFGLAEETGLRLPGLGWH
jgi:N-acetyl-gamma-glutamyl-phosphate reductase common form